MEGVWIFVFVDMMIFLLMFLTYVGEKIRLPEVFSAAQQHLNVWFGISNTILLLTSSWLMVEAVNAARRESAARTAQCLSLCLLMGGLFALNKIVEYAGKVEHGFAPATNSFFALYFVITGLHFLHVIGGMFFIFHCRNRAKAQVGSIAYIQQLESVGLFWHFVDVLWIFIFPLLYLAGLK
jgi:nitric oxide reductase NorE protein